jgi:hypothetical protein
MRVWDKCGADTDVAAVIVAHGSRRSTYGDRGGRICVG